MGSSSGKVVDVIERNPRIAVDGYGNIIEAKWRELSDDPAFGRPT